MGQDSWNLQYGRQMGRKYRKGAQVDMHNDEGYGGPKMVPGYAGAYKNSKTRVLATGRKSKEDRKVKNLTIKPDGNPRTFGPNTDKKSMLYVNEEGVGKPSTPKRRK